MNKCNFVTPEEAAALMGQLNIGDYTEIKQYYLACRDKLSCGKFDSSNITWILAAIFHAGQMAGIRSERARRKGGAV